MLELDAHFGISGPTDEETEESDGLEYRVTFPPNRGFSQQESNEQDVLLKENPMLPVHDAVEAALIRLTEEAHPGFTNDPHTGKLIPKQSKS